MRQLAEIPTFRMEVHHNGSIIVDDFIYGMVTNSVSVGGIEGLIAQPVDLHDGMFEVTLIRLPRNPIDWNEIISYLTGTRESTHMIESFQASELTLRSPEAVPWTLDGEFGGKHHTVTIRNYCQAMEIIV